VPEAVPDNRYNDGMLKQTTIFQSVRATGVGLHSGTKVELVLRPAPADTGIVFTRTDLNPPLVFPANANAVGDTRMASTLTKDGQRVSTVEHLLSAVAGWVLIICILMSARKKFRLWMVPHRPCVSVATSRIAGAGCRKEIYPCAETGGNP
jgi:hypothetical protein